MRCGKRGAERKPTRQRAKETQMNLIQEFALLFAVAIPVLVIFGMNLALMLEGERGTLMFPSWPAEMALASTQGATPSAPVDQTPANEPHFPDYRHAA